MVGEPDVDVLIVGLGPVGAMAANLLGQAGCSVLVIEQSDGLGLRPRAGGLDDENQRLLQAVGLIDEFLQTSQPIPMSQVVSSYMGGSEDGPSPMYDLSLPEPVLLLDGIRTAEGVGRPGAWTAPPPWLAQALDTPGRNGYAMGARGFYQPKFEEILRKGMRRFHKVRTLLSTRCLRISQTAQWALAEIQEDRGGWKATPGNEVLWASKPEGEVRQVRCKFVIGCDGARSAVRGAMGEVTMQSLDYDERWWSLDVKLRRDDAHVWGVKLPHFSQMVCDPRRAYIMVPLWQITDSGPMGRHVRFDIQVADGDEERFGGDMLSADRIRDLISPWLGPDDCELVRYNVYRFWSLVATRWRQERLFLAGDACHTMPPFLGQGLNQGFRDVANLTWKIAAVLRGAADDSLLDTYQAEREPIARNVVRGALSVGKMIEAFRTAARRGREALQREAENYRGKGLMEQGVAALDAPLPQKTDGAKLYPVIAKGRLTGRTLPQVRVLALSEASVGGAEPRSVLLDYVMGPRPSFVLVVASARGAAPTLSAASRDLLAGAGGSVLRLALAAATPREVEHGCEYRIAADSSSLFRRSFAALVRPDRIVLGATEFEHAEHLVDELKSFFLAAPLGSQSRL